MRDRLGHLTKSVAIYGMGDAAVALVNFVLLPVYVKNNILTKMDFGAIALIGSVEALAKVTNRWGLDAAFMRFYFERDEGPARQRLASTIVWSMVVMNGLLLAVCLAASGSLARWITLPPDYLLALRLMLVNMFLMSFTFVPLGMMQLHKEAALYSAFTLLRSAGSVVLRIVLVIGLGYGVAGMYLVDVILTVLLLGLMFRRFRSIVVLEFSRDELRKTLRFGLPLLPHGLASQTLDANPKLMLGQHVSADLVGVYQNGVTLGTGVSFFKNAFQTAFAPFFYANARQPDAKEVFSKTATYGVAVLVLLVAGTTAVAHDVILLLLKPEYLTALPVVPLVAIAFALQGGYQWTSIGLNMSGRTEFYPMATIPAALVSVGAGLWLIPSYGVLGAAVTVLVSYGTQAGLALAMAQRIYPVSYETGRLLRIVAAGVVSAVVALAWPLMPALVGFFVRGVTTVVVFFGLLWASGFLRSTERAFIRETIVRARRWSAS